LDPITSKFPVSVLYLESTSFGNHKIVLSIAPMTTKSHDYPTRVSVDFRDKIGWVVLDQIRTVDKERLTKKLGSIDKKEVRRVKSIIKEMLVD